MLPRGKKSVINESDVVMYLATGLKHLRLMVLLVCMTLLLGINFYVYSRSIYYSQSQIRYRSVARPVDSQTIWNDSKERAVLKGLQAPHVMERTARRLGISYSPRTFNTQYVKKLTLRRDSENNIVVEIYAYSYRLARDWAPTMMQEYLASRDERRIEYAEAVVKSFSEDMAQMRERIDKNFDLKFDYKEKNEMDKVLIQLNELRQLPRELLIVKYRLSAMDRIRNAINDHGRDTVAKLALLASLENDVTTFEARTLPRKGEEIQINIGQLVPGDKEPSDASQPPVVVLPSVTSPAMDTPWMMFDKEQRRLQMELAIKGRTFLPGHPQMAGLKKQLDNVNKSLDLEFAVEYRRFNLDYLNLVEKQKQLELKLPEYQEIARRHEKLLKEYTSFDRGQVAWNKMYISMSKTLEMLDFGFDKDRNVFEFGGYTDLRDKPVSPRLFKLLIYSVLLGMALAIAIPFLMEYLSNRVSDVEHAEETLQIRGLGVVPKITEVPFETLLSEEGDGKGDYHLKENFRLIRTNLVMNSESPSLPQVILVTSAMPQEGKTVVAANLALSFAAKGEKTLLIDGDLRRGRVHRLFGVENRPGLSNLLNENLAVEQICRPNGHENLTLMTCGKHLNGASELLDSAAFTRLIEDLRGKYQRIILDTPPVLGLSETVIMQRIADGVLMVIWSEFTPMSSVKSAVQSLQTNGAKFSGFVLNRLDFTALTNRYKYFYYAPLYYSNYAPLPAPPAPGVGV